MFMNRHIALPTKLFSPDMVHVTSVPPPLPPPCGANVNSAVLVPAMGLKNSMLMRTSSPGRLSVIVIFPSPTSLFPTHEYTAPTPAVGPSYVFFIAGSTLSHGFHASHF